MTELSRKADLAVADPRQVEEEAAPQAAAQLRVLQVSYTDAGLGAARAAYRLHRSLLDGGGESRMLVRRKRTDDWTVRAINAGKLPAALALARPDLGAIAMRLQRAADANLHSANLLPSRLAGAVAGAQLVNLHWVAAETMSVEDIGRIRQPLVLTLHDMWAFCGAEHYAPDGPEARWRSGYRRTNRPVGDRGLDIDRWTWQRKRRAWRRPIEIVCPSHWLAACARSSALMRGWPISVVPNPLDTAIFKPRDRAFCRSLFDLPQNKRLVLFGAAPGEADGRKGCDLLFRALWHWTTRHAASDVVFVLFGQSRPRDPPELPVPTIWLGRLADDAALAALYAAADVMVVPSRQENLVQTGTEAQACGCPVIGFDAAGMPDVVEHRVTGYLAAPYDTADLAEGIAWTIEHEGRRARLGQAARERAVRLWSPSVVCPQYRRVYQSALRRHA